MQNSHLGYRTALLGRAGKRSAVVPDLRHWRPLYWCRAAHEPHWNKYAHMHAHTQARACICVSVRNFNVAKVFAPAVSCVFSIKANISAAGLRCWRHAPKVTHLKCACETADLGRTCAALCVYGDRVIDGPVLV